AHIVLSSRPLFLLVNGPPPPRSTLFPYPTLFRSAVLAGEIITSLTLHCKQSQWVKDGGVFIPHPTTWLNQQRWEDEIDLEKEKAVEQTKKKMYIGADRAYEKDGRIYVITHTGAHCEYGGSRNDIEWR